MTILPEPFLCYARGGGVEIEKYGDRDEQDRNGAGMCINLLGMGWRWKNFHGDGAGMRMISKYLVADTGLQLEEMHACMQDKGQWRTVVARAGTSLT